MGVLDVLQRYSLRVGPLRINAEQFIRGLISGSFSLCTTYFIGLARAKSLPRRARLKCALGVVVEKGLTMLFLSVIGVSFGMVLTDWYGRWALPLSRPVHNLLAGSVMSRLPAYSFVGSGLVWLEVKRNRSRGGAH
jgi:hypothetical protein